MAQASTQLKKTINKLSRQKQLALLFDFDGTLSPIVRRPHLAKIVPSLKKRLKELSKQKRFQIAIVSGRDLKTVKKKVGLSNLIYVGNHGYEILFPKKKIMVHPSAKSSQKTIAQLCTQLKKNLKKIRGAMIENKIYSASLHTRTLTPSSEKKAHTIFDKTVRKLVAKKKIKVTHGKKVREIRPPAKWNKGKAVLYVLRKLKKKLFPVYVGDDKTDEDAFKAIRSKGLGVRIGSTQKTRAHIQLKNPAALGKFLSRL